MVILKPICSVLFTIHIPDHYCTLIDLVGYINLSQYAHTQSSSCFKLIQTCLPLFRGFIKPSKGIGVWAWSQDQLFIEVALTWVNSANLWLSWLWHNIIYIIVTLCTYHYTNDFNPMYIRNQSCEHFVPNFQTRLSKDRDCASLPHPCSSNSHGTEQWVNQRLLKVTRWLNPFPRSLCYSTVGKIILKYSLVGSPFLASQIPWNFRRHPMINPNIIIQFIIDIQSKLH
jgi:hypothetical protein